MSNQCNGGAATGFRYETHLHTSDASACGKSTPAEHVAAHYEAGYTGFVVADHFFNGNTAIDCSLPWDERVHAFCRSYENALAASEGLDFDVFFGLEFNYYGTEFLTYGLDKAWLLAHPALDTWPPEKFFDRVHKVGGFVIHAHPFRVRSNIKEIRLYTDYIDAVEVVNLGNDDPAFDEQALTYAREHHLPVTHGSDIHNATCIQNGGMTFPRRPHNIFDLIALIKETTE